MKIAAFSNWKLKFLGVMIDWWRDHGHEVEYRLGYDPKLHKWSDLCFVDVADHNAKVASGYKFPGSKLVIRCIDIECWVHQPSGVDWSNVDLAIFGARHIEEYVRTYVQFPDTTKVVHIPFGVNPDKWTFRERDGTGTSVAFVAHRWSAKGIPLLLQIMHKLGPPWTLHCLGTPSTERWLHHYIDHAISEMDLTVIFERHTDDMNAWLQDKDVAIVSGQKEAFSYAAAEAALCGIKPVIHNFWRAKDIWPEEWVWTTIDEAVDIIHRPPDSHSYRDEVVWNYSIDLTMMALHSHLDELEDTR